MSKKEDIKERAERAWDSLMYIDAFLNGLEIASDERFKENVYDIKKKSFEIRGFLLKFI